MNDAERLKLAKEDVYQDGFYTGVMVVGEFAGKKVQDAKLLIKARMIEANDADTYYEPESRCVSRSGDICVVALCDQWYITYGTDDIREKLKAYVKSNEFSSFNETIKNGMVGAIDWLKNWGCSRSFGLGSRLPADPQFLIESLSDSTIYMAYYTVSNILHNDLNGAEPGKYGVTAANITDSDWDYVFLKQDRPADSKLPEQMLEEMRTSFSYWYPFDLRCSGKDLIKNHLTMSLYNHEFIWGSAGINMLPKGIFCNGWVLVDGEKMSKSKGNFLLVGDICDSVSADVLRISLANAGDSLDDANVEIKTSDKILLKLATLEGWLQDTKKLMPTFRETSTPETEFFDRVFESKIKIIAGNAETAYEKMLFRGVVREAFYNMAHIRDEYKFVCGTAGPRKDLIRFFIEIQLLLMYPVTPHFSEVMWQEVLRPILIAGDAEKYPKYISHAKYPVFPTDQIDMAVIKEMEYLQKLGESLRSSCEKIVKRKPGTKFAKTYFIVASKFLDWQVVALKYLQSVKFDSETKAPLNDWKKEIKELYPDPKVATKALQFVSFKLKEYVLLGPATLSHEVHLDEATAIKRHIDFLLKDSFDIGEVAVLPVEEAAQSKDKNLSQNVDSCKPGEPLIAFEFK
jgi:leucyl-tRNA synthetase